jgi:hypothetical protein
MAALNHDFAGTDKVTPIEWKLNLIHKGKRIDVQANLKFKNTRDLAINKYVFSLNPGLKVENILSNQQPLDFNRDHHIISVTPSKPLAPNSIDSLTIHYNGNINEQACYLDIENEERFKLYRVWLYNIAKRFAIIEPNYVLKHY